MPKRKLPHGGSSLPRIRLSDYPDESTAQVVHALPSNTSAVVQAYTVAHGTSAVQLATVGAAVFAARRDTPVWNPSFRGSLDRALGAAISPSCRDQALADLERDVHAPSARGPQASYFRTWETLHYRWFGDDVPALPLTVEKIRCVSALLKGGGYRGAQNYYSRIKDAHVEAHPWNDQLARAITRYSRSVLRGIGPARQSAVWPVQEVSRLCLDDTSIVEGGPLGVKNLIVAGALFLTRGIELELAVARNITIDVARRVASWLLPADKTDPKALGKTRSWSCVLPAQSGVACPHCALVKQLALLHQYFGCADGSLPTDLPLFPNRLGKVVGRSSVVRSLECVASLLNLPLTNHVGQRRFGEHSLRVTGAQELARRGVPPLTIQCLARWESDIVMRYVAEAPLSTVSEAYRYGSASNQLMEIVEGLVNKISGFEQKLDGLDNHIKTCVLEEVDSVKALRIPALSVASGASFSEPYVLNELSGTAHKPRQQCLARTAPADWRTMCGWSYGLCLGVSARRANNLPTKYSLICGKCLPDDKLSLRVAEEVNAFTGTLGSGGSSSSESQTGG